MARSPKPQPSDLPARRRVLQFSMCDDGDEHGGTFVRDLTDLVREARPTLDAVSCLIVRIGLVALIIFVGLIGLNLVR